MQQDWMNPTNWDTNYAQAFQQPQQQQSQPKKQKGKGGFLSSLISEIGGAGGAAGGAAIGGSLGSIVPGIGTGIGALIGAGLGGFIGGTGGRAVENKVRDNQNFFGQGGSAKSALTEGALAGALSAAGEGFQLFKAGKAATGIGDLAKGADTAVIQAPKTGLIQDVGNSIKSGAEGIGLGAKVPGQAALDSTGQSQIQGFLKTVGIKPGAPETIVPKLDNKLTNLTNILDKQYSKGATALSQAETQQLGANILDKIAASPLLSDTAKNNALNEVQRLVSGPAQDTSSLWKYIKELNANKVNWAKSADAASADTQTVAKIFSNEIRSTLNNKVPGVAATNDLYHTGQTAKDFILAAAKDNKGGGLVGTVKSLAPVKGLEAKAGAGIENVGKALAGTAEGKLTGPVSQVTRQLKIQSPANLITALSGTNQPQDQQLQDPTQQMQPGMTDPTQTFNQGQQTQGNDMSQSNALQSALQQLMIQDLQKTGGKRIAALKSVYDTLTPTTKKSTADQSNQDNILSALSALDSSENNLVGAGGAKGPAVGQLSTVPMLGQLINHQGAAFHNTRIETATQLAKALTGSTRPAAQVIQYYLHSLPDVTDTPQYAAQKLAFLRNDILKRAQANGVDISAYTGTQLGTPQPSNQLQQALSRVNSGGYQ